MKKTGIILMTGMLAITLFSCSKVKVSSNSIGKSNEMPKQSNLNKIQIKEFPVNMSEYIYLEDKEPAFQGISLKDSIKFFKDKGSGLLYYGRANCPWCQRAVPVLNDILKKEGFYAYYINVQDEIEMSDVDELITHIESTFPNGDFQIPLVIAVKDGEIVGSHLSLVDGFVLDSDDAQMDEKQIEKLSSIYKKMIEKVMILDN